MKGKLTRKVLAFMLTLAMVMTYMPALAFATGEGPNSDPIVTEEAVDETATEATTPEQSEESTEPEKKVSAPSKAPQAETNEVVQNEKDGEPTSDYVARIGTAKYATLEDAVKAAEEAGEGTIELLDSYDSYPQAWVTDCVLEGDEAIPDEAKSLDPSLYSFYTYHAFNPNKINGGKSDEEIVYQLPKDFNFGNPEESLQDLSEDDKNLVLSKLPQAMPYLNWASDFEVSFDSDIEAGDVRIAGNYGDFQWIPFSLDAMKKDEVRNLLNKMNFFNYQYMLTQVFNFHCGVINENPTANAGKTIHVDLCMYDPKDDDIKILIGRTDYTFPVAKIDGAYYKTLADAVSAAQTGDTVEILKADTYKLPNVNKNITIKGKDGVVIDAVGSGSIASVTPNVTFESLTFNFGQSGYHGFQHAGTINMNDCTLNGLLISYGDMNFTNCTFNQVSEEYNMWAYGNDLTYKNCTFNSIGKFVNVYCESNSVAYNVIADGCTFNSSKTNKAAFNVKETCGSTMLKYNVDIKNCHCNENFPEASNCDKSETLWVIDPLVQIDDRKTGEAESGIKVKLDDQVVYPQSTVIVDEGDKEASATIDFDYAIDEKELNEVVEDPEVKEAIKTNTAVSGLQLTSEATESKPSGMQAVLNAAVEANNDEEQKEAIKSATKVEINVDVKVKPIAYTNSDQTKTVSYKLEPVATVKAYVEGEDEAVFEQNNIVVTNDMIDREQDIVASIYTGFGPKAIFHLDKNGSTIEKFEGNKITYDDNTGVSSVTIHHFSTLLAVGNEQPDDAVAQIVSETAGVQYFTTLQEAINAANTDDEVKLLADIELSDTVSLSGKNITLDFDGYKVTCTGGRNGTFSACGKNKEQLTIKNGTVEIVRGKGTVQGGAIYAGGDNNTVNLVDMTIVAGEYEVAAALAMAGSTITLTNTNVKATGEISEALCAAYGGKIIVNSGNIEATGEKSLLVDSAFNGTNIEIKGGNFSHNDNAADELIVPVQNGIVSITGGYYDFELESCVASGYVCVPTDDSDATAGIDIDTYKFKVVEKPKVYVARIGDKGYETIEAAISEAQSGDTIVLLADFEDTHKNAPSSPEGVITIPDNKNVVIDLNGHTVNGGTKVNVPAILNYGTVEIKDTANEKGLIKRDDKLDQGAHWYVIKNEGIMTLNDINVYNEGRTTGGGGASMIENGDDTKDTSAQLTINSGNYSNKIYTVVKVEPNTTAIINGGTFDCSLNGPMTVQTYGTLTVNGGSFTKIPTKSDNYAKDIHGTVKIHEAAYKLDTNWTEYIQAGSVAVYDASSDYKYQVRKTTPSEYDAKLMPNSSGVEQYFIGGEDAANIALSKQAGTNTAYYNVAPTEKKELASGTYKSWYAEGVNSNGHYTPGPGYALEDTFDETTKIHTYSLKVTEESALACVIHSDNSITYYDTLVKAGKAAQAGETVKALKDNKESKQSPTRIWDANSKSEVTVDLAGKQVDYNLAPYSAQKITIVDSVGGAKATSYIASSVNGCEMVIKSGGFTGTLGASNGGVLRIEGGYYVNNPTAFVPEEGSYEVITLVEGDKGYAEGYKYKVINAVAQIGDVKYETLQEAIDACQDGVETTITMIGDEIYGSNKGATVDANKKIILDLAGHTIATYEPNKDTSYTLWNKGTLTITDSEDISDDNQANGSAGIIGCYSSIEMQDTAAVPGYATNTITNAGTLTVNAGKIINQTIDSTSSGFACYAIDNDGRGASSTSMKLTINGGKIENEASSYGIRMYLRTTGSNEFYANGGYLSSLWVQEGSNGTPTNNTCKIELKNCEFKNKLKLGWYSVSSGTSVKISNVKVGSSASWLMGEYDSNEFEVENLKADSFSMSDAGKVLGENCYFMQPVANKYIKTGYYCVINTDNVYNILGEKYKYKISNSPDGQEAVARVLHSDGKYDDYSVVEDAIDAADNNETVQLLMDSQGDVNIDGKSVAIDLNGFTLNGTINVLGKTSDDVVTIKDSSTNKTGKISSRNCILLDGYTYWSGGPSLIIEGGNFECTNLAIACNYCFGNVTINGGNFSDKGNGNLINGAKYGKRPYYPSNIAINGGTFDLPINQGSLENPLNISGGTFNESICGFTKTITGGTFNGDVSLTHPNEKIIGGMFAGNITSTGKFVSGGYFKNNIDSAYVVDGYNVVKNTDDETKDDYPWTVGIKQVQPEVKSDAQKKSEEASSSIIDEHQESAEEIKESIADAIESIENNSQIEEVKTKGNEKVDAEKIVDNHLEEFQDLGEYTSHDTTIVVELEKVEVTAVTEQTATTALQVTVGKVEYEVTPTATVTTQVKNESGEVISTHTKKITLTNNDLKEIGAVKVRLAIPHTDAAYAKVTHVSSDDNKDKYPTEYFTTRVLGSEDEQYVEIDMTHFSTITIETLDQNLSDAVAVITNASGVVPYTSLAKAIADVQDGQTITVLKDCDSDGISVDKKCTFTIDFDGHTVTFNKPGAGSNGTKTQALQLLSGQNITLKNGTLECASSNRRVKWKSSDTTKGIAMMIQNYCNLTLNNMYIDGTNVAHNGDNTRYVISNNSGTVNINDTTIEALNGDFALDTCKFGSYDAPTVNVTGESNIYGDVDATGGAINLKDSTNLDGEIVSTDGDEVANLAKVVKDNTATATEPEGYMWSGEDHGNLVPIAAINENTGVKYATLAEAFAAVTDDTLTTIKVMNDCVSAGISVPSGRNITLDLNNKTVSFEGPGAGSAKTKTNGLQLLKDSNIVIKNGKLDMTEANKNDTWVSTDEDKGIAMLIQNYADLTLKNVEIDGTNIAHNGADKRYVMSNNSGNVVLEGTTVNTAGNDVAFDTCKYDKYQLPTVEVKTSTINGDIALGGGNLTLTSGTLNGNLVDDRIGTEEKVHKDSSFSATAPDGFKWDENNDLVPIVYVARVTNSNNEPVGGNDGKYETITEAIIAANGVTGTKTIQMIANDNELDANASLLFDERTTLDMNGYDFTSKHAIVLGTVIDSKYSPIDKSVNATATEAGSITVKENFLYPERIGNNDSKLMPVKSSAHVGEGKRYEFYKTQLSNVVDPNESGIFEGGKHRAKFGTRATKNQQALLGNGDVEIGIDATTEGGSINLNSQESEDESQSDGKNGDVTNGNLNLNVTFSKELVDQYLTNPNNYWLYVRWYGLDNWTTITVNGCLHSTTALTNKQPNTATSYTFAQKTN